MTDHQEFSASAFADPDAQSNSLVDDKEDEELAVVAPATTSADVTLDGPTTNHWS